MTTPTLPTILQVQDLAFAHPGQPPLFAGWSATIPAGITLLHGDSGSGKSTLLRLLAGTQAVNGRLTLDGIRFDEDAAAYRQALFWREPATTEFDPLSPNTLAQQQACGDPRFDQAAWQRHVAGFGLTPHADKPLYQLSTGSKRKVWLAIGLASVRPLTLLDEPGSALDAASIAYLMHTLAQAAAFNDRAVLVASHDTLAALPLSSVITLTPP